MNRPLIEIKETATFVVTEAFLSQVKYLNSRINEVEWSGIIYYTTEGSPQDLATFKIIGYYIHLMDKIRRTTNDFEHRAKQ